MAQDRPTDKANPEIVGIDRFKFLAQYHLLMILQGLENPSDELRVMVDDLLNDLSNKFNSIASEITAKSTSPSVKYSCI